SSWRRCDGQGGRERCPSRERARALPHRSLTVAARTFLPPRRTRTFTMGITVAYRGRLADLTRVEDFEDRLLDFALEVGGLAQLWRSYADDNPRRLVRGVILDL